MPYAPLSHPFVEPDWNDSAGVPGPHPLLDGADLEMKLFEVQRYYNGYRVHAALDGRPPVTIPDEGAPRASLRSYRWQSHCRGLHHTPIAA